jgi:hypothetical protein
MRVVGQFLTRFWVAALTLAILLSVLSIINVIKLVRKTWGWHRGLHTRELLRPPQ